MKDNGEEHFEFVYHNVFAEDVNETKWSMQNLERQGLGIGRVCFITIFCKECINGQDLA